MSVNDTPLPISIAGNLLKIGEKTYDLAFAQTEDVSIASLTPLRDRNFLKFTAQSDTGRTMILQFSKTRGLVGFVQTESSGVNINCGMPQ